MSEGVQGHANSCASSKLEDRRGTIRALGRTQRLLLWLTSVSHKFNALSLHCNCPGCLTALLGCTVTAL
eukprot:scaffold219577_cov28-Tisochrysis_lutea.AAC.1